MRRVPRFVPESAVPCIPRAKPRLERVLSASVPLFRLPVPLVPARVPAVLRGVPASATFRAA